MNIIKNYLNKSKYYLLFLSIMLTESAYAQGPGANLGTMFASFQASSQALIKLVIAASMVIGLYLIANSIYKMAVMGDGGGQRGDTMKGALTKFFVGVMIFSLMFSLRTVGETMMMGSGPGDFLITSGSLNAQSQAAIIGILWFIRLVGFLALARGFLLLDKHGQGGRDGELGRGLTHIFGGVAAIHVDKAAQILVASFAPGVTLPF